MDSLSDNDIALLKIDAHGLPTVMLGDSDKVQIGNTVYAIGCPAGVCGTITEGRVANLGISSKTDEGTTLHNLIMSDLTTTHGSSGGPLLNDKGEVIGITTAGIVVQGETTGFGVSIPINQAIPLLRKVPGFSTSQMGRAITVLTLDGIRRTVGLGTVFVRAEVQRALTDLLPREALGRSLVGPEGSGITLATNSLWNALQEAGIGMNGVGEVYNKTVSGDTTEEITMGIFDCASAADASRALTYLNASSTWDLSDPRLRPAGMLSNPFPLFAPPLSFDEQVEFLGSWAGQKWKTYRVLLSTSREIGGVAVNTVIYYDTHREPQDPDIDACLTSGAPASERVTPSLALWGFGSFSTDNLVFLIVYGSLIVGPEYPACGSGQAPLPGGGTFTIWLGIPYEWNRVGHSFVFSSKSSRLFSVNYDPFLDNFDRVISTAFQTLANQ